MVILFVTPYLRKKGESPKGGGLEAYLFRVTGALKKMGHTPIIVSLGDQDMHYMDEGIEVFFVRYAWIPIREKTLSLIGNRLFQSMIVNRKVREIINERTIDVIQFASPFGLASCYYGKIPSVMRLSSYAKTYYRNDRDVSKIELNIQVLLERLAACRCNAVFAPSYVIANDFSKDVHRKVSLIETPFWNECEICDDSVYQDYLSGKKYFLFIGRLSFEKGILVIAEILQQFLERNSDYYFVCCGEQGSIEGQNSVNIVKKAAGMYKDRFIYMQPLLHEMLYPIIMHADFVICPSIMDNLSNACMEAMYFERVVIGTDGTSYEQLIIDGRSGLLCIPGNAESLLEKMEKAAAMDEAQKAEMGKYARKRIDKLAPERAVGKLLRYYQYIIDHVRS